ncbi:MAG: nicotinate phosphoribosyltransferase [Thermoprotei archaeon]|nr:MAG: nicotinate phosphoribosyltransferase [Thermoprotei archaeon]
MDRRFLIPTEEEIAKGLTTDIYFIRTKKILQAENLADVEVCLELTASSFPPNTSWAVLGGLRDALHLLEGLPVDVYSMREGTIFYKEDFYGTREPIMFICGRYGSFIEYETPILGFLSVGSGIATKAARIKKAAGDKLVLSFGARRTHPAVSPFNAFYAFIGGCDAVSCIKGADFLGIKPTGTMPHSLMIIFKAIRGDHSEAWIAFDKHVEADVPRVILADTFDDEVEESIKAVQTLNGKLWGLRLDTPGSRRGNFPAIIREVKWKLKALGYKNVKIVVSGGVDEEKIPELIKAGVDAFGVGAAIANARIVDIAMDIVAVKKNAKWMPISKRGKFSGIKQVYRCWNCMIDVVKLRNEKPPKCPKCLGEMKPLLGKVIENGKIVIDFDEPSKVREYVMKQFKKLDLYQKPW